MQPDTPRPPRRRRALLVVLAVIAAACGGGEDAGAAVATLDDSSDGSTTSSSPPLEPDEALLEFSACMRDNGIDLPDIGIGPNGVPLVDPGLVDQIDIQSDEFGAAFAACISIIAASGAFQRTTDPEELAAQRDQLVTFSQCMRDEGIVDFPDPNLSLTFAYPFSAIDVGNPAFDEAVEICQEGIAFDRFDSSG